MTKSIKIRVLGEAAASAHRYGRYHLRDHLGIETDRNACKGKEDQGGILEKGGIQMCCCDKKNLDSRFHGNNGEIFDVQKAEQIPGLSISENRKKSPFLHRQE